MEITEEIVQKNVRWLANIGADSAGGTTRLLYDENWQVAQRELSEKFKTLGLTPRYDAIGNLFAKLEGSSLADETIMTGSHVDTVVHGGSLDGQLGIIGAYLAVKHLKETYGQPLRSIEIVSMAEEEGSRFPYAFWGSKNIFGQALVDEVREIEDAKGIRFVDAMKAAGFTFRSDDESNREDIKAFVELHIEQGNVLEKANQSVGIVNNIVGQKRYYITLTGEANHAGTTPMNYRRDAVYGMSKIIQQGIDRAVIEGDPLVLTFGHIEVQPNTVNVVPGKVKFSMDCRHTSQEKLDEFTDELIKKMSEIAQETGLNIEIDNWMNEAPTPMSDDVVAVLIEACKEANLNYRVMHSGAGHDSQIFAQHVPTAMIFVPSIKGISHNPAEATEAKDLVEGVKALAASLYKLAYIV